ncbi:MAG: SDR family oxidoreductase [Anaerolineae bacterium]|nr:SDR family oxidoreductase [Anaerolineae bacterium]
MDEHIFGKRFEGQVALVTGAGKGIGRACALRFAREGACVALLSRTQANNDDAAAECRRAGAAALALRCDVASQADIHAAFERTLAEWGRIDIVVAAAGVYSGAALPEVPLAQWQRTIDTNLTGVFLTDRAAAPIMMRQRCGSIINVSSVAGVTSWQRTAEYSAAKSGVIGLTRSVAVELAPYGVTCNALCPGSTRTDQVLDVARYAGMSPEAWLAARRRDSPTGRVAEPWEMAGVAAFLASPDARYINGQSIVVDGGINM